MKVAILFSGGKDSTFAIQHALEKKWEVEYLLSIKPTRTDCFLFHYATVEHTSKIAQIIGLKHYLLSCDFADSKRESNLIRDFVLEHKVEALVLGGTGLQITQIKSLQDALHAYGIEVFAAHAEFDHDKIMEDMLEQGYKIVITQVATDGGGKWLGKEITKENFNELKADSLKYGFHIGFEGGYMDTFVLDAPIFNKKLNIVKSRKVMEDKYSGHLIIEELTTTDKIRLEKG
ncbi:diphthine--ammonia ligase [Candidatus Woesearchaeota archaeon]|nr:diphthine--ammonia ligase [Candidatus Woesearchaeota archaeon]